MYIDIDEARRLCTPAEFRLIADSENPLIHQYTAGGLSYRLQHARRLATLWRLRANFLKRLQYSPRRRLPWRTISSYETAHHKALLFREVAERFRARLAEYRQHRRPVVDRYGATTVGGYTAIGA